MLHPRPPHQNTPPPRQGKQPHQLRLQCLHGVLPADLVPGLEPQDHLGHDVVLDLIGSGIDRGLAVVEIVRRQGGGIVRTGPGLIADALDLGPGVLNEGLGVETRCFQGQFGDQLLGLAALELQH